jgi:hypothetical protein
LAALVAQLFKQIQTILAGHSGSLAITRAGAFIANAGLHFPFASQG